MTVSEDFTYIGFESFEEYWSGILLKVWFTWYFLLVRSGLWVLRRKIKDAIFITYYQRDSSVLMSALISLPRSCLSGFTNENLLSPPFHTVLFGKKSLWIVLTSGGRNYVLPSFFFFFNFIFKLCIIVLVLPNIKMNPPQVYMCSPSWTLLPPPSPFHPSWGQFLCNLDICTMDLAILPICLFKSITFLY